MSRIAQPPTSRSTGRTPSKTPATSSSRLGGASSPRKPTPSPTPDGRTLRPQTSLKSLKPSPSPQKSPLRRPQKLVADDSAASSRAHSVSIREQIALRRAEAKKATGKGLSASTLDDLGGLEEALPTSPNAVDDVIDLGRWSVKETIERARTTGELLLLHTSVAPAPRASLRFRKVSYKGED